MYASKYVCMYADVYIVMFAYTYCIGAFMYTYEQLHISYSLHKAACADADVFGATAAKEAAVRPI